MAVILSQGITCYRSMSTRLIKSDTYELEVLTFSDLACTAVLDVSSYACTIDILAGNVGSTSVLSLTEASASVTMSATGVKITLTAAQTAGLAVGTYRLGIRIGDLGTPEIIATVYEGILTVDAASVLTIFTDVPVTSIAGTPAALAMTHPTTVQLGWTILPATATDKRVTFASSAAGKATVSAAGLITTIAAGDTNITITSVDDPTKTAVVAVTVS